MNHIQHQYLKHANDWSFVYQYYGNTPENLPYLNSENNSNEDNYNLLSVQSFVTVCGYLAVFSAMLVTMAPIPIMMRIRRENSVGALPLLPFSSMTINCFAWFTYGFLIAEPTIWIPNLITLPLTLSYVMQYIQHSRQRKLHLFFHLLLILISVVCTTMLTLQVPIKVSTQIIGTESMILAILRDCSSLVNVPDIIRKKCASPIPVAVTLASTLNAMLWLIYGKVNIDDFKVYAPNLLRLLSNVYQLYLVKKYGVNNSICNDADAVLPLLKIDNKKLQE